MGTDLFGEVPEPVEQRRGKYHEERFWQLNALINDHSQGVWQYLQTVNGGGAIAMLAYIGAVEVIRKSSWPYWALSFFIVGLILVGFSRAYMVHRVKALQDCWKQDIASYYEKKVTWGEVLKRDQVRGKSLAWLPWALGWSALVVFLLGVVFTTVKMATLTV